MRAALAALVLFAGGACAGTPTAARVSPDSDDDNVAIAVRARSIAAGGARSCLIEAGEVYCWGMGSPAPRRIEGLSSAVSVAAYQSRVCAIDPAGTLRCTTPPFRDEPDGASEIERFDALGPVVDVSLGRDHSCALGAGGALACWGDNDRRSLGVDAPAFAYIPVRPRLRARAVEAGIGAHTCGIDLTGRVQCWGAPFTYGNEPGVPPERVAGVTHALSLAVGERFACAASEDGTLACWGRYPLPDAAPWAEHRGPVCPIASTRALAAGEAHVCALSEDGVVRCLADRPHLRGDGVAARTCEAAGPVVGLDDAVEIAAGDEHTCARRADGSVVCWGRGEQGQLGRCLDAPRRLRRQAGLTDIVEVGVGRDWACARSGSGELRCWGRASYGDPPRSPDVVEATEVERVWVGAENACVQHADGAVRCLGRAFGTEAWRELRGAVGARDVAVDRRVVVLSQDAHVYCYGCRNEPRARIAEEALELGEVQGGVELALGLAYYCARTEDGHVRCGRAFRVRSAQPSVELPGVTDAVSVQVGQASLANGELVRWETEGLVNGGELHLERSALDRPVRSLVAGGRCVRMQDSSLRCWDYGTLRDLGLSRSETPTPVPDLEGATQVATGGVHGCAVIEGDVWCWGRSPLLEIPSGPILRHVCVEPSARP